MKWISAENLTRLIQSLRERRHTLTEASNKIASYGIPGNTWLAHCLMYENDITIWDAWKTS
jgi:hypothetical protein